MKYCKLVMTCFFIITVTFLTMSLFNVSYADFGGGFNSSYIPGGSSVSAGVQSTVSKIWNTATLIVRILSIGAIVIAGIRYMFSSADQKADIKQGILAIIIGSVLVYAATAVAQFVVNVSSQVGIG